MERVSFRDEACGFGSGSVRRPVGGLSMSD